MAVSGVENSFSTYTNYKSRTEKCSSVSFSESINKSNTRKESVVDEFKKKHPKEAGTVNGQVNAGKAVLKKNGAENVSREDMTMEEYKQFFTKLMKSIPFASMPGYSPNLHTEQFGASIEEHLGQSVPMSSSGQKTSSADDEENWWEKRHKKMEEFMEQQEKKAIQRRAMSQSRNQQAQLMQLQMQMMANAGFQQFSPSYMGGGFPASLAGALLSAGSWNLF